MSYDNIDPNVEAERLRRQEAEASRNAALNVAADQAVQKDAALYVAAGSAAERDAATTAAAEEARRRQEAEQSALAARSAANSARWNAAQSATESTVLRENLATERERSSNANFGFYFLAFCVFCALIGVGIWYFSSGYATGTATNPPVTAVPASSTTTNNYIP